MSIWGADFVDVVDVGYIRKHGASRSGLPRFEMCLANDCVTTPMIKELVERGRVAYAEVLLDGSGTFKCTRDSASTVARSVCPSTRSTTRFRRGF